MPGVKVSPPILPDFRLILVALELTRPAASVYAVSMLPTAVVKCAGVGAM